MLLPLQNHMPLIMQVKTMMNMTIMIEIKNVKRWHGQSIVTINCSCTNYRCISDIWRHGIKQSIMVQKKIKSRIQIKIMLMKVKIKTHLKTLLKINQNLQTVINQKMIKTKRLKMNLIMIKTTLINRTTKHKIIKINNKLIKINNSNNNNNVKVVAKDIQ